MTTAAKLPTQSARHTSVMPVAEARKELSTLLKRFTDNDHTEPVYIGAHRKAEAVLVPLSLWEQVLDFIDDLEIAKIVKERGDGPFEDIPAEQFAEVMRKYIKENQ
jgi:PHD/YefM family antitoxin component YafN of YafNO toxin-antitoxin module